MTEQNPLSSRESEILTLLAQGKSNKEIASELVISVNTVKVHISNIFQKLEISSRAEAMMYALEQGIIEAPQQETPEPEVIREVVPAELPKWVKWFRKFWWIPLLGLIIIITGLSFIFSKTPMFNSPTPTQDTMQLFIGENRWQKLESPSLARSNAAIVNYRNQIFSIGGEGSSGISATTQSFDTRTNQWTQHTPKPQAIKNAQAILHDGKIFVFGGETKDGVPCSCMEVYDPIEDTWIKKKNASIALSRYAATVLDGKIYFFGGWDGQRQSRKTIVYNPYEDRWQESIESPTAVMNATAVNSNGRILIIGGSQEDQPLTSLRIFSPGQPDKSKMWSEPLQIFDAKEIFGAQLLGDSIVVVSENKDENLSISYYSLLSETWMHTTDEKPADFPLNPKLTNISGSIYFLGKSPIEGSSTSILLKFQAIYTIMIPAINN